jgi:hypothetical protein
VPFFFKLITDRTLREPRTEAELRAEVAEDERKSAERHRQIAEEEAKYVHHRKGEL